MQACVSPVCVTKYLSWKRTDACPPHILQRLKSVSLSSILGWAHVTQEGAHPSFSVPTPMEALIKLTLDGQLISSGILGVINFGKSHKKVGLFKCAVVSRIKSMSPESEEWAVQTYIFCFQSCYNVLHFETLTFNLKALSSVCSNLSTTNWNFHITMK